MRLAYPGRVVSLSQRIDDTVRSGHVEGARGSILVVQTILCDTQTRAIASDREILLVGRVATVF